MIDLFTQPVLNKIGNKLLKRRETIAVAESVTSGLLQFAFSNIPDAAKFFQGGITAYNIGQKCRHLQVEPLYALEVNCVAQQIADNMALQVSALFSSDWSIGITGYASPVPESDQKLFAYYSILYKTKIKRKGKIRVAAQAPPMAQLHYVNHIILQMYKLL